MFLVVLQITSSHRLGFALQCYLRRPYVLAALIFSIVWIVLFASIGNLGILARERTQLIPWLMVLVCLPSRGHKGAARPEPDVAASAA